MKFMPRFKQFIILIGLVTAIWSCESGQDTDNRIKDPVTDKREGLGGTESPTDTNLTGSGESMALTEQQTQLLLVFNRVNLGMKYSEIHKIYPLQGIRPESVKSELADEGLTEAVREDSLWGKVIQVEFNFKKDTLYSYFIGLDGSNNTALASRYFDELKSFYSRSWGESSIEKGEEDLHYDKAVYWQLKGGKKIILKQNLNSNKITWGVNPGL